MKQLNNLTVSLRVLIVIGVSSAVTVVLYLLSNFNYLLFHTVSELFSIVIAFGLFLIAWNGRGYSEHGYLTHLGIAYFFIALLDLLHTLSYKGIAIFPGPNDFATELWIATRYLESITLLLILFFAKRSPEYKRYIATFLLYTAVTAAVISSIFILQIFPVCFIEGQGLTPFKKISEYIISALLAGAGVIIFLRRRNFEKRVYRFLLWSIVLTICSELAFTFYIDKYGLSNFIGHLFKVGSFYLIYKAIIETAFKKPVDLLFQRLQQSSWEKDRIFSIIGHDLKNPVSGIETSSDLLLKEYNTFSNEEIKDFLSLIRKSARVSTRLLDNLLLWARVQTGKMEADPEVCPLRDIVSANIGLYSTNAKQKDISIRNAIPAELSVYADMAMLDLVVKMAERYTLKQRPRGKHGARAWSSAVRSLSLSVTPVSGCRRNRWRSSLR